MGMKKVFSILFLVSAFILTSCNSRFSALSEPVTSQVSLIIDANANSIQGQIPLNQGCVVALESVTTDGGLLVNNETGEFWYMFQDLNLQLKDQDQFAYRENCRGDISFVKVVIINTQNLH